MNPPKTHRSPRSTGTNMNTERRDIVTRPLGSAVMANGNRDPQRTRAEAEQPTNLVGLCRNLMASEQLGVVSERDMKHIVTTQFEYPPVQRDPAAMSASLVAAFTPFSAKGRAIRYLAARLLLEAGSERSLCFAVCGSERRSGTTYIAANLAVAFSEFGLRTLLIDANHARPELDRLFACEQAEGLATPGGVDAAADAFIARLPAFRDLSLLPAGAKPKRRDRRPLEELLMRRLRQTRPVYDVVICDAPERSGKGDECEVVAGVCGSALSVFRRNHTRLSSARALLSALDGTGARPIGSVLCEF